MSKHHHHHPRGDSSNSPVNEKTGGEEICPADDIPPTEMGAGGPGEISEIPNGETSQAGHEPSRQERPEESSEEKLSPEERIAQLEDQLAQAKDQYLRKAADFENFRKRMNQEKQSAIEYANQSLILDILPVIDDLERAIKAAETALEPATDNGGGEGGGTTGDFKVLWEGISMIEKRLVSQLENKWGLKRFDSAGEPFDPNRHEAIMMEKSPEITEPVVQEDFVKGYTLKDRVIRAAKVKVLMPE